MFLISCSTTTATKSYSSHTRLDIVLYPWHVHVLLCVCIMLLSDDQPKLKDAFRMLLPLAAHWRNIGVLLGIKNDDLHIMNRNYTTEDDCLREKRNAVIMAQG